MKHESKKKEGNKPRVMPAALVALASVIVTVVFMSFLFSGGGNGQRRTDADVKIFLQPDGHLMRTVAVPGSVVPAVKDDPECPKCKANQVAICKQAFVEVLDSMRIGVE
jgi:hypothetical protein